MKLMPLVIMVCSLLGAEGRVVQAQGAPLPEKSIRLRQQTLRTPPPQAGALAPASPSPAFSGLILVQLEAPLTPPLRQLLDDQGVRLLHYVPEDAFVARVAHRRLTDLSQLAGVRWCGPYLADYKLHPSLKPWPAPASAPMGAPQAPPPEISILAAPDAPPADTAGLRARLQNPRPEARFPFGTILRGTAAAADLPALTGSAHVLWLEPAPRMKLLDEVSSKIVNGPGEMGSTAMKDLGYDGRGVTVAVADSGLDSGIPGYIHPDLDGRVVDCLYYGTLTDGSDEHSHGTHCAGIIAGDGATGELDDNGFLYGLGVAPGVRLLGQRIFGAEGDYQAPPTHETLTRDAVRAGADIGSNSWGEDTQGAYDLSCAEFDALVRDADALTPGDQPYILEFSAGNAGPGVNTMDSPAAAKNVISSGASQNDRPDFILYSDGIETMADFSSRGPCADGRLKPDVVAPGTWIASLRSVFANDSYAWSPISDYYLYQGGTSQAGPQVSGAAAIFVQFHKETRGAKPSPALTKAALIHSAVDLDDTAGTLPVPNMDEGWGRVDLTQIIGATLPIEFLEQATPLATGQSSERRVILANPGSPLKITLAYTDAPGFPGALPALVNDLDLEVVGPDDQLYRGNQFEDGESVPNPAAADTLNNVEGVLLSDPLPGEYLIRVRARNVVMDARADTGPVDQDFALVYSGDVAPPGLGVVTFDRPAYTAPDVLKLRLVDPDLAGQPQVALLVRSGTETNGETLILKASGTHGLFTNFLPTAAGPAAADGRLQVANDDLLEAVYLDAAPAATRVYTARADLRPPVISAVTSTNRYGQVAIVWTTDEQATGTVFYGTNTVPDLAVTNRLADTQHEVLLPRLPTGTTCYYYIVATDLAGNHATNNNSGTNYSFTVVQPPDILLVDAYQDPYFNTTPPLSGYTDPLDQLGASYTVWDTSVSGHPTLAHLQPFRAVIWRVPDLLDPWTTAEMAALSQYLTNGGSLLVSSMEVLSRLDEINQAAFRQNVLQVQAYAADAGVASIAGEPGDPLGSGLDLSLDYTPYQDLLDILAILGMPGADPSDTLTLTTNASPILRNETGGVVGLRSPKRGQDRPGRLVFLSFPLDAVPLDAGVTNNRVHLLRNILAFLAPSPGNATLALDNTAYTAPGLATVEVEDFDLAGTGPLTVTGYSSVQTNGQSFTLPETSRPGLFRAQIPLVLSNAPAAGQRLAVQTNDTLQFVYLDATSGSSLVATSSVETIPPVISAVTADPGYADTLISWDTSEPADALVQFGESPLLGRTAYDDSLNTTHVLALEGLKSDHLYYYRVVSRDRAGNTATDDQGGALHTFTTLRPLTPPWTDTFEDTNSGWSVITSEDSEGGWEWGVPDNGQSALSPTHAWASNLGGQAISQMESYLVSPAIDLTGGNHVTLRFWQNYDFSEREGDITEFGEVVVISSSTGAMTSLGQIAYYTDGWEEIEVDLSPFAGQVVYVGWHYFLLSFEPHARPGWLLEDVSITVSNLAPGVIEITNNLHQAAFSLNGPTAASGRGRALRLTNAVPGTYILSFGAIPWFQTPPAQTNELLSGGLLQLTGTYTFDDTNANGMSDDWERAHFGGASPSRTRATDTDGDGSSDHTEFLAGTNPTNAASALRLLPPVWTTNGQARVTWIAVKDRGYRLESGSNLTLWAPASLWQRAPGNGYLHQLVPAPTQGPPQFYRLEVQP